MFNVTKKIQSDIVSFALEGRLDANSAPELEEALQEISADCHLVLDFEELVYISSAGLRVLLSMQKRLQAQGSLKLIHVHPDVMEIFDVTGFSDLLDIE